MAHLYFGLKDRSEGLSILSQGLRASGTVVGKENAIYNSPDEIQYSFYTGSGDLITNWREVGSDIYNHAGKGGSIEIAYDPANPTKNFPVEQGVRPLWHITLWTIPPIVIGFFLIREWINKILRTNL